MLSESTTNDTRSAPDAKSSSPESAITIALVGATPIAEQIAARALRAGLHVIIDDISDTRLQSISINLQSVDSPPSGFSSCSDVPCNPNLTLTQSIHSAILPADFILDTLPDDLEVKLELFTLFDKFAKPNAIFITSGSIPVSDLAEITFCPDRCIAVRLIGMANDAETSFQLVAGPKTSPQALAMCSALFSQTLVFRAA